MVIAEKCPEISEYLSAMLIYKQMAETLAFLEPLKVHLEKCEKCQEKMNELTREQRHDHV